MTTPLSVTVATTPPLTPEQLMTAHHVTTELPTTTSLSVTTPPPVTTLSITTLSVTTPPPMTTPPITTESAPTTRHVMTTPQPVTKPVPPPAMKFTATQSQTYSTLVTRQHSSDNEFTAKSTNITSGSDNNAQDQSANLLVIVLPVTAALLVLLICSVGFGVYMFIRKKHMCKASQQHSKWQASSEFLTILSYYKLYKWD